MMQNGSPAAEATAVTVASQPSDDSSSENDTLWVRRLKFGNIKIKVEEEWGAGIGGTLWEGAVLMASCKKTFDTQKWRAVRCIELGAGATGIPGIVAAQLGCFREVVITDVDECMRRLRENVAANLPPTGYMIEDAEALPQGAVDWDGRTAVRTCELDWRQSVVQLRPPFEVVLVADVLYEEGLVDPLLTTLRDLSTPTSLVVIAIYNRSETTSARFWKRLPHFFSHADKIAEETFNSAPQPDDVGIFVLHH